MRNILKSCFSLIIIAVLAFSGCEAGLTAEGDSGDGQDTSSGNGFSFSNMYSRMNSMEDEIESLKKVNLEQAVLIDKLKSTQSNSEVELAERIDELETNVGAVSIATLNSDVSTLKTNVGAVSIATLNSDVSTLKTNVGVVSIAALNNNVNALKTNIGSVSIDGLNDIAVRLDEAFPEDLVYKSGNNIIFESVNVQIVNGTGSTASGLNGLGNLVVGYNESRYDALPDGFKDTVQTGSHNVIVGGHHNFSSYGGIVAGRCNSILGAGASVIGGKYNIASGVSASVVGGSFNTASGDYSVVP
ncbi:MAG: hypothetical protein GY754_13310 [bacterium]|nr:hypothetical protein [bacterium]